MENKHLEEVLDALGGVIAEQKEQISIKNWRIADLKEQLEKAEARVKELEKSEARVKELEKSEARVKGFEKTEARVNELESLATLPITITYPADTTTFHETICEGKQPCR